jgi:hypothetical protein
MVLVRRKIIAKKTKTRKQKNELVTTYRTSIGSDLKTLKVSFSSNMLSLNLPNFIIGCTLCCFSIIAFYINLVNIINLIVIKTNNG